MFVLFLLFLGCLGSKGAWQILYVSDKSCSGDKFIVSKLNPECINDEKKGKSYYGTCNKEPYHNVTFDFYDGLGCSGPVTQTSHLGVSDQCKLEEYKTERMLMWKCLEDYKLDFKYLDFSLPLYIDQKDVGSSDNPIIANNYYAVEKCIHTVKMYHISVTCDPKTQEGEIKQYHTGICLIPISTIKAKPGDIVNMGKGVDAYMKYNGCTA